MRGDECRGGAHVLEAVLCIVLHVSVVDDYFGGLDASTRAVFEHIRTLVMDIVPEAEDSTSYGMAALTYKRKPLLGFRAAKDHLSVFPFSAGVVDAVRDRLPAFEQSKGTIRSPSPCRCLTMSCMTSSGSGSMRSSVLPAEILRRASELCERCTNLDLPAGGRSGRGPSMPRTDSAVTPVQTAGPGAC